MYLIKTPIDSQEVTTLITVRTNLLIEKCTSVWFISLGNTRHGEKQVPISHIASDYKNFTHTRAQKPVKNTSIRWLSHGARNRLPVECNYRGWIFVLRSFSLVPKLCRTFSFCLWYSAVSGARNLEYFKELEEFH